MESLELLLDESADAAVRARWAVLADTGLPSQAAHSEPFYRPHATLARHQRIDAALDPALAQAVGSLPLRVVLGGLLVFAGGRNVLALAVIPSADLLAAHMRVHDVLTSSRPLTGQSGGRHLEPGRWTPHVTLARGLTAGQVGRAVAALGRVHAMDGSAQAVRSWDGATHGERIIASA